MESLQTQMNSLKTKIHNLATMCEKLQDEKEQMHHKIQSREEERKKYLKQIQNLEEENKKLKIVSAISGNQEYRKLMKLKLNKLIKEVDLCIVEVKSKA